MYPPLRARTVLRTALRCRRFEAADPCVDRLEIPAQIPAQIFKRRGGRVRIREGCRKLAVEFLIGSQHLRPFLQTRFEPLRPERSRPEGPPSRRKKRAEFRDIPEETLRERMRKPLKRLIRKRFVVIPRHKENASCPVAADGHIRDAAVKILRQLKHEQKIGNGGQVVPRGGLRAKSLRIRFADKAGFRRIPAGCISVFRLGPEFQG